MKRSFRYLLVGAAIACSLPAFAEDEMGKKDAPASDGMAKDGMAKDGMAKDGMGKKSTKKSKMKKSEAGEGMKSGEGMAK